MTKRTLLVVLLLLLLLFLCAGLIWFFFGQEPPLQRPDLPDVVAPADAQLLYYPLDQGIISAGYQNDRYIEKNGYQHYGTDITVASGPADVLASGRGIVLGTESCDNSLGNIAVIRYDNVFLPESGEVMSLIARYYHMDTLRVAQGDQVAANQVIGTINRGHESYNHVHLELDRDTKNPFDTPQVAEEGSALLNRWPSTGEQLLEPLSVLVVGPPQWITSATTADCVTEKDRPRVEEAPSSQSESS